MLAARWSWRNCVTIGPCGRPDLQFQPMAQNGFSGGCCINWGVCYPIHTGVRPEVKGHADMVARCTLSLSLSLNLWPGVCKHKQIAAGFSSCAGMQQRLTTDWTRTDRQTDTHADIDWSGDWLVTWTGGADVAFQTENGAGAAVVIKRLAAGFCGTSCAVAFGAGNWLIKNCTQRKTRHLVCQNVAGHSYNYSSTLIRPFDWVSFDCNSTTPESRPFEDLHDEKNWRISLSHWLIRR